MNLSYLHKPGHHRNPKNSLTLTWTLQQEQRKKVNNGAMLSSTNFISHYIIVDKGNSDAN